MFKNKIILGAVVIFLGMTGISFAMSCHAGSEGDSGQTYAQNEEAGAKVVDVGNKVCPVMGGGVNGANFSVYNGKRYGLCCPRCPEVFAGDPEKYSAIADKEVAGK